LWLQGELSSLIKADIEFVMLESNVHVCGFCGVATGCCLNMCPHAVLLQMSCFPPADELQDLKHLPNVEKCICCPQEFLLSLGVSEFRFPL